MIRILTGLRALRHGRICVRSGHKYIDTGYVMQCNKIIGTGHRAYQPHGTMPVRKAWEEP
jgi:hypothetical protein